ncbi:MAG: helix-turn-helix domain-containing protein [Melioribacteraceae bacterium]|nr:helix-turn-helix domain-containing protein [Melioribacteraceae bacterium]
MIKLHSKNIFAANSPIHIGATIFEDTKKSYEHNHDFCEFFFIETGELIHYLNDKKYSLTPGSLCFINAKDKHSFQKSENSEDVIMMNVAFKEELYLEAKNYLLSGGMQNLTLKKSFVLLEPLFINIIKTKIDLLRAKGFDSFLNKKSLLFKSLLIDVLMQFVDENHNQKPDTPEWLTNALRQIHKSENFVKGLNCLIKLSGKTQEHLTRTMKKHFNITPTAYINSLRLNEAVNLLLNSDLSITDIMFDAGFNNVSHFMKLFKEKFGLSPANYRKRNRIQF